MSKIVTKNSMEKISLDNLQPSPLNTFDTNDYQDLKNSILNVGLLTPLTVIGPDESGMYTILCGERRYLSLTELNEEGALGTTNIPCYVVGDISMNEIEQQLIIESSNLETRDDINVHAHRFQIIKLLKELEEKGDIKHKEITSKMKKYMNVSARYRRMYLQIFEDAVEPIREMVENGEMRVQTGDKIASLPKEAQEDIAEAIKGGMRPNQAIQQYSPQNEDTVKVVEEQMPVESVLEQKELPPVAPEKTSAEKPEKTPAAGPESSGNSFSRKEYENVFEDPFRMPSFEQDEDTEFMGYDSCNNDHNINMDIDTSGQIRGMLSEQDDKNYEKQKTAMVIDWCKKMLQKDNLPDEEMQAVEYCREVADKFL